MSHGSMMTFNLIRQGGAPSGRPSVDGRLQQVTYLGNALIYTIALDWMQLDVRGENRPHDERLDLGDEGTVSWEPGSVSVVRD